MTKKRKITLAIIVLVIVFVALMARPVVHMVAELLDPGKEDLSELYSLSDGEVALVVDDELLEEKALQIDGETYVPAEIASGYMDQRLYVDTVEDSLSYTTADGTIVAKAEQTDYVLGKEQQTADHPVLTVQDGGYYISLTFIGEHASCYYRSYDDPSRLVIMYDRDAEYTIGTLVKDTRIRTGPNKKYKYYTECQEGEKLFIEKDIQEENEYIAVTTMDGISGYVPKERITDEETSTWEFEKSPETFSQLAMDETVCLGWHQVTNESSAASLPSSVDQAEALNVLCPTWYALSDNSGNFDSLASSTYVTAAHAKGLKVWGLINDFGKEIKLSKVLGVTENRTKLINNLVTSAILNNLDGINIDFENVTMDNAAAYLQFLRELTIKCHANDLVVSVDNYTPADYNAYYDLAEQGRIVDYVILMAYDEHYDGDDESGSVSSLSFVENGVQDMLAEVSKERMIVALPFYTRLWKEVETSSGVKVTSEAYGMSSAESVVRANDATATWDDTTGQYYAEFKSSGATYKIWLEEETSLQKKLEVATENQVAGVAFWKLGFERAVTWTTIKDALG